MDKLSLVLLITNIISILLIILIIFVAGKGFEIKNNELIELKKQYFETKDKNDDLYFKNQTHLNNINEMKKEKEILESDNKLLIKSKTQIQLLSKKIILLEKQNKDKDQTIIKQNKEYNTLYNNSKGTLVRLLKKINDIGYNKLNITIREEMQKLKRKLNKISYQEGKK